MLPRACLKEEVGDIIGKTRIRQVYRRHVDRYVDAVPRYLPAPKVPQRSRHDPRRERANCSRSFRVRDEIARWNEPLLWVPPPDQGLTPDQMACGGGDLGLIVQFEFVRGNGTT